ncbi:MAG: hypothetical protein JXA54_04615 [Candidatus Heimdallarchaeota archaeon]|nr:hypothetical protein [Candidatus Heimdallarchaeota archaeon]
MDIRTLSSHNYIPIIDPAYLKQSPDEFLAENGGFLSEVAVIAKSTSGFVHFRSAIAPTDRDTNEFFSTFTSIADSIGIKVYALVNGLADSFLAKNPGYSAIKDGGNPNPNFIDPFKTQYTNYLKGILTEIISFPIHGVLLDNIRFPRENYSFCENCRRQFSERYGIERIFSLGDMQRDNNLYTYWNQWRANALEAILEEMSVVTSSKKNVPLSITIDIDPTIGPQGAFTQYGQKIDSIAKYGVPTIHLSPWSPYPSTTSVPEYQTLKKNLQFAKAFQEKNQIALNLYLWGVESESFADIIDDLKKEISIAKIFVQNHIPQDYQKRREIHLGLS